ncbi:MAG: hypothetical protein E7174_04875 [Firmicutes bacterium]|nr:hypothetical protein [Bacillota bacterium]
MKKNNNRGFMLVETLVVTTFVAGVLIFLFVQFSKLSKAYEESYIYNTVEGLYALEDVRDFIWLTSVDTTNSEGQVITYKSIQYIQQKLETEDYIDITDCSLWGSSADTMYQRCKYLFSTINIDKIFITKNAIPKDNITGYNEGFKSFINKINEEGNEPYRIVASFNNSTYATLRFGDSNE